MGFFDRFRRSKPKPKQTVAPTQTKAPTQSFPARDFGDTSQQTPTDTGGLPQQTNIPKRSSNSSSQSGGSSSFSPSTPTNQSLPNQSTPPVNQSTPTNTAEDKTTFQKIDTRLKERVTNPIFSFVEEKTGKDIRGNIEGFRKPSRFIEGDTVQFTGLAERSGIADFERGVETNVLTPSREFTQAGIASSLEDIRDKPLKNVALLGAGFGVGVGIRTVGAGLKIAGGAIGGTKGASIATTTGEIGLLGAGLTGTSFAITSTTAELSTAETAGERGAIIGVTGKDIGLFGAGTVLGVKGFDFGKDIFRTRGLTEVPTSSVVAPEIAQGQTFPLIKKGQTAGQLQSEFFQPSLPTETKGVGRAFTASGDTFKAKTVLGEGSSEVAGLFGSPKVSAHFLRTQGEKTSFFGAGDLLGSSSPTALRLTPKSIELAPGIKPSQKTLGTFDKKFFESIEGSGKSFIPFAKTEKEAVTAFGTPIAKTKEEFFFKFGGRRVPIKEFEVVGTKKPTGKKVTTLGKETSSSSLSRKGSSSSIFNPTTIGSSSLFRKKSSSSVTKPSSSNIFTPSSTPKIPSSKKPTPPSRRIFGGGSSIISSGRGSTKSGRRGIISSSLFQPTRRRRAGIGLPHLRFTEPRRKIKGRKKATPPKRTPSLAAVGLDIRSTKAFRGERTSLGIRPILVEPKKKKRRKKK